MALARSATRTGRIFVLCAISQGHSYPVAVYPYPWCIGPIHLPPLRSELMKLRPSITNTFRAQSPCLFIGPDRSKALPTPTLGSPQVNKWASAGASEQEWAVHLRCFVLFCVFGEYAVVYFVLMEIPSYLHELGEWMKNVLEFKVDFWIDWREN